MQRFVVYNVNKYTYIFSGWIDFWLQTISITWLKMLSIPMKSERKKKYLFPRLDQTIL